MTDWTLEQKFQQASGNALISLMIITAYTDAVGKSVEDFAKFAATKIAPGWESAKGAPAIDICKSTLFNPVSMGATVVSLEGDEKSATGVLDWDLAESAEFIGVSVDDVFSAWDMLYKEVLSNYGVNFSSSRDGNNWTFNVSYD